VTKTKLRVTLLVGLVVLSLRGLAKDDHAPLPEQCIADYNLWSGVSKDDLEKLPLSVIQPRALEMWNCTKVVTSIDSERHTAHAAEMILLFGTYNLQVSHMELSFIERHGLLKKFVQEDAAGQR